MRALQFYWSKSLKLAFPGIFTFQLLSIASGATFAEGTSQNLTTWNTTSKSTLDWIPTSVQYASDRSSCSITFNVMSGKAARLQRAAYVSWIYFCSPDFRL